ncbi:MAG TPA: hypothetical protein VGH54_21240 [Mycobacterium sp.]|uniref:hypothetical protein n=1 Tax=Mycobacterium sp. TaxID=1785 RepID=UPI002F3FFB66
MASPRHPAASPVVSPLRTVAATTTAAPPARAQLASTGSPERELGLIALALLAAGLALLALGHHLGKGHRS